MALWNGHQDRNDQEQQRRQQEVVALRTALVSAGKRLTAATYAADALRDRCQTASDANAPASYDWTPEQLRGFARRERAALRERKAAARAAGSKLKAVGVAHNTVHSLLTAGSKAAGVFDATERDLHRAFDVCTRTSASPWHVHEADLALKRARRDEARFETEVSALVRART